MAQQPIPEAWRSAVCAILKKEDRQFIKWTLDARERFESDFSPDWGSDAYAELRRYLNLPNVTGCPVNMGGGETWEFLYPHKKRNAYGKICLTADKKKIMIYSVHVARKNGLSCD
ncbi:MAG: hypothetical protein V4672_18750 [Verrucomicrobiota bacterium]